MSLPIVLGAVGVPEDQKAYLAVPTAYGSYSYISSQIHEETSDIDVLFVGPSVLAAAIDPSVFEAELTSRLGRPARVVLLGFNWAGADLTYLLVRDVLRHRKVGLVVTWMHVLSSDAPHLATYRLQSTGSSREFADWLEPSARLALYAGQVLAAPRHLLSAVREDKVPEVPARGGPMSRALGFGGGPLVPVLHEPPKLEATTMLYSSRTISGFGFRGPPLTQLESTFLIQLRNLLTGRHIPLMFLNVPLHSDLQATVALERINWPAELGPEVMLMGAAPPILFPSMTVEERERLYFDDHLNVNGTAWFSRAVAPAIGSTYVEKQFAPR